MFPQPNGLSLKRIFLCALVLAFVARSKAQTVTNVIDRFDPSAIGANTYSTGKITNIWKTCFGSAFQSVSWEAAMDANTVVSHPTNLDFTVSGGTLTLNWPVSHLGWTLHKNSVNLASPQFWFAYPGSMALTNVIVPIDPTQANVSTG
jgi:hypothetical protein